MENDIEEIRKKIEDFMAKYDVTVEIETTAYGFTPDRKLAVPRAKLIIHS